MLHLTIQDSSLYLLFEWNTDDTTLTIVVTDAEKKQDSNRIVRCAMVATDEEGAAETAEKIQYWIRDYLTTCDGFFAYSLVAIFHSYAGESARALSRNNIELL